jgi:hypothetical protein
MGSDLKKWDFNGDILAFPFDGKANNLNDHFVKNFTNLFASIGFVCVVCVV